MKMFAADLHLGHRLSAKNRGFSSIQEHDDVIIDNLMNCLKKGDNLYLLGDTFFTNNDDFRNNFFNLLRRERINVHFIRGNHDKKLPNHKVIKTVSWIKDIKENGQHITLCHYPMLVWNRSHYNSWLLHGHIHKDDPTYLKLMSVYYSQLLQGKRLNVNIDFNNLCPFSFDEVKAIMDEKEDNFDLIVKK